MGPKTCSLTPPGGTFFDIEHILTHDFTYLFIHKGTCETPPVQHIFPREFYLHLIYIDPYATVLQRVSTFTLQLQPDCNDVIVRQWMTIMKVNFCS